MKVFILLMLSSVSVFAASQEIPKVSYPIYAASFNDICIAERDSIHCEGTPGSVTERKLNGFSNIRQVAVGVTHVCVLDDRGVICYGDNSGKQSVVPYLENPRMITVGNRFSCAVDDEGLKCWGVGLEGLDHIPAPENLKNIKELKSSLDVTCALDQQDELHCWGNDYLVDALPEKLDHVKSFYLGSYLLCIVTDQGDVRCWGEGVFNELSQVKNPKEMALGYNHFCILNADNKLQCWGAPSLSVLKLPVKNVENITHIYPGLRHACMETNHRLKCWGDFGSAIFSQDLIVPAEDF